METCTNCGASLRPGAKFCTTCGTRLNDMPTASNDGWGTPRTPAQDDVQETSVLPSVQSPETPPAGDADRKSTDSWSSAYSKQGSTGDDPAGRFISALDDEVTPVPDDAKTESPMGSSWESPAPVFTPPPPSNWSYSGGTVESAEATSETDSAEDSNWVAPSTWTTPDAPDEPAGETDAIADESDEQNEILPSSLQPDELRDKAIELADELRKTVRLLSGGGEHDHGAAVMALTEVSLGVGDYSDVRGALAEVRNDPRDIETLTNLASKVDRLEALLDEHKALADAIETAIRELNG